MTARTLFSIILKIIGVLFIKDILLSIPQLLGLFTYTLSLRDDFPFGAIALFILSIGSYCLIAYWLIFRSEWIIEKLRLAEGFDVDPIRLNMHRSTVLSICLIVIGAMMIIHAVPLLVKEGISYYQHAKANRLLLSDSGIDKSFLITYAIQLILGLVLVGNQRQLVSFIELRRRNAAINEE
jgi:hypothetical protein